MIFSFITDHIAPEIISIMIPSAVVGGCAAEFFMGTVADHYPVEDEQP